MGFPGGSGAKESAGSAGFNPWVGKIPWRREWQSTPVFLPGNPMNPGYGPWGRKESDMTE